MQRGGLWHYNQDYNMDDGTTWNIKITERAKKKKGRKRLL